MKKIFVFLFVAILGITFALAQEEEVAKVKDKPVTEPFGSGLLIDNQTCFIPSKKTIEMVIQHRFGPMNNGIHDVWGIYQPGANIRVGFNYVVIDKLQLGYGLTMLNMTSDFSAKYNILEQTRKNTIPVFVTAYVNMGVDGRKNTAFGDTYNAQDRFSYFSQLIVGRKFSDNFALQVHGSFTHFNKVQPGTDHDVIGIGFNGRYKFSPQSAIHFQYDQPLKIESISEYKNSANEWIEFPVANVGIGYEVNTGAHSFQVYILSSKTILPQYSFLYNTIDETTNDAGEQVRKYPFWSTQNFRIGFTMTRLWSY
jgi:hypothetical protein